MRPSEQVARSFLIRCVKCGLQAIFPTQVAERDETQGYVGIILPAYWSPVLKLGSQSLSTSIANRREPTRLQEVSRTYGRSSKDHES